MCGPGHVNLKVITIEKRGISSIQEKSLSLSEDIPDLHASLSLNQVNSFTLLVGQWEMGAEI